MSAFQDYARNLYGPKLFGELSLVVIQATIAGGAGVATKDDATSSPEVTIARSAAGQYDITYPPGQIFIPLTARTVLAEQAGSEGYWEAFDVAAGTASLEFATTPGTAAEVADDTRLVITALVGRF